MLAHYHLDPLDRRITLRRLHVLLARIPAGVWSNPETAESWSIEAHLLAGVVDWLGSLVYVTLKAAGVKNPSKPVPIPRPGAQAARQRPTSSRPAGGQTRSQSWTEMIRSTAGQDGVQVQVIRN